MLFKFLLVILTMNTDKSEAHVFCQDAHATSWTPLGYSCPVNCASIIEAVRRLSENDYNTIFSIQTARHNKNMTDMYNHLDYNDFSRLTLTDDFRRRNHKHNELKQDVKPHYYELYKVLNHKNAVKELQKIFTTASKYMKYQSCDKLLRSKKYTKIPMKAYKKCARRSDIQGVFIKKFAKILNKYSMPNYMFTVPLTTTLLEKPLGSNLDLRRGILNVKMILKHLRQAIFNTYQFSQSNTIIKLKSKFCLNVYMPGCFCIPGLVESRGQCVKPADCFPEPLTIDDYLARIVVQ